jgi:hypothetical protein
MSACVLLILCWIGFQRYDMDREMYGVSKREFERMLANDRK